MQQLNLQTTAATFAAVVALGMAITHLPSLHGMAPTHAVLGNVTSALTCHWSHWTWTHWAYDFGAFALLGIPCITIHWRKTLEALSVTSLAIPLAVALFLPEIGEYKGLSGLCSTLYALLAVRLLQQEDRSLRITAGLGLALFCAKLGYEFTMGTALFVTDMGPSVIPVPLAHLIGGAIGILYGIGLPNYLKPLKRYPDRELPR